MENTKIIENTEPTKRDKIIDSCMRDKNTGIVYFNIFTPIYLKKHPKLKKEIREKIKKIFKDYKVQMKIMNERSFAIYNGPDPVTCSDDEIELYFTSLTVAFGIIMDNFGASVKKPDAHLQ